jgi:hypothetical protein
VLEALIQEQATILDLVGIQINRVKENPKVKCNSHLRSKFASQVAVAFLPNYK